MKYLILSSVRIALFSISFESAMVQSTEIISFNCYEELRRHHSQDTWRGTWGIVLQPHTWSSTCIQDAREISTVQGEQVIKCSEGRRRTDQVD